MGKYSVGKSAVFFGNLGFTLVELMVVILILAIVTIIALGFINPVAQIHKVKDITRQNDLNQLYTALDTYYNDKGCYPTVLSQLTGTPIYIKKIPTDPDAPEVNYVYVMDPGTNNCPQWFNIITRAYKTSSSSPCILEQLNTCLPINYTTSGYNLCKISGKVDCSFVAGFELPILSAPNGSPTPTVNPNPTPTLVPGGCYCVNAKYDIRAGNCNLVGSPPYNYCDSGCTIACTP